MTTSQATTTGAQWHSEVDSYDLAALAKAATSQAGDEVLVGPRSVTVLRSTSRLPFRARDYWRSHAMTAEPYAAATGPIERFAGAQVRLTTARRGGNR